MNKICLIFILFLICSKGFSIGKDTLTFKMFDEKGKEVSISKFKGKVVYLDFWASWCGSCKQYMEKSKLLHAKFTKKQLKKIVFLYLSVDNDPEVWKKSKASVTVEGIHLLSPANSPDGAYIFFRVTGMPRYVIIDKKGEITSFIAKTPYQEEVFDELLKLIEQ